MIMNKDKLRAPRIVTRLPGPRAAKLIQKDETFTSPSYTRAYPLAVSRGKGAVIEDVDGNRFLDFTAGIAVCSTGHCHPRIVRAIQEQAARLIHMSGTDFYYGPQTELAAKLAAIAPGDQPRRVFFTNSGAEAVEAAFKLARFHTKRKHMIAFFGAFHGRTLGALSLTGSKVIQRADFSPLIPQVSHVDFPNCSQCTRHRPNGECCFGCLAQIDENLFKRTVPPDEVAAIIVEPIQGESGYLVPPPEFHRRLKDLTERHGILYIVDEVQSGMGRTGKMFAIDHWGVVPDIICIAKGVASGMPLGAIIANEELMDWPPGSHASTFGGNPVSCMAALETIDLLQEELIDNAQRVGERLFEELIALQQCHSGIFEVRGKGLMIGVELASESCADRIHRSNRDELIAACFRRGLLLLGCGTNTIRFCPPLVIDETDVETAVAIFDAALGELNL